MVFAQITPPDWGDRAEFAYQDFGDPGTIISDTRDERFGFRLIRFANGVRLTLKPTTIREDRIAFTLSLDGGDLMNTREAPMRVALTDSLALGGLGKHSQDELSSVLAGRSVGFGLSSAADAFSTSGNTSKRDLALQMQVLAAYLTDPGLRPAPFEQIKAVGRSSPARSPVIWSSAVSMNGTSRTLR